MLSTFTSMHMVFHNAVSCDRESQLGVSRMADKIEARAGQILRALAWNGADRWDAVVRNVEHWKLPYAYFDRDLDDRLYKGFEMHMEEIRTHFPLRRFCISNNQAGTQESPKFGACAAPAMSSSNL